MYLFSVANAKTRTQLKLICEIQQNFAI